MRKLTQRSIHALSDDGGPLEHQERQRQRAIFGTTEHTNKEPAVHILNGQRPIQTNTDTDRRTDIHTYIHTYQKKNIYVHIHTNTHTGTVTVTDTHTHTHKHTHTHTHTLDSGPENNGCEACIQYQLYMGVAITKCLQLMSSSVISWPSAYAVVSSAVCVAGSLRPASSSS